MAADNINDSEIGGLVSEEIGGSQLRQYIRARLQAIRCARSEASPYTEALNRPPFMRGCLLHMGPISALRYLIKLRLRQLQSCNDRVPACCAPPLLLIWVVECNVVSSVNRGIRHQPGSSHTPHARGAAVHITLVRATII